MDFTKPFFYSDELTSEASNERILDQFESVPSNDVTSDDEGPDEKHFGKNTVYVSSDQLGSNAQT